MFFQVVPHAVSDKEDGAPPRVDPLEVDEGAREDLGTVSQDTANDDGPFNIVNIDGFGEDLVGKHKLQLPLFGAKTFEMHFAPSTDTALGTKHVSNPE